MPMFILIQSCTEHHANELDLMLKIAAQMKLGRVVETEFKDVYFDYRPQPMVIGKYKQKLEIMIGIEARPYEMPCKYIAYILLKGKTTRGNQLIADKLIARLGSHGTQACVCEPT